MVNGNGSVQSCIIHVCGYIGTRIRKDFIGLLREVERKENTKKVYISIKNMGSHPIPFHVICPTYKGISMKPLTHNMYIHIEEQGKPTMIYVMDTQTLAHTQYMGRNMPIPYVPHTNGIYPICPTCNGIWPRTL